MRNSLKMVERNRDFENKRKVEKEKNKRRRTKNKKEGPKKAPYRLPIEDTKWEYDDKRN